MQRTSLTGCSALLCRETPCSLLFQPENVKKCQKDEKGSEIFTAMILDGQDWSVNFNEALDIPLPVHSGITAVAQSG